MSESTLRQLDMMKLMPRYPSKISTTQLKEQLEDLGYLPTMRMVQRDLEMLASVLPLICDDREKPYGWSWHKDALGVQPAMDPIEALTFSLAEQYLEPIMPGKSFNRIKIFFDRANSVLKEVKRNQISRWRKRVRVEPQWQRLLPANIDREVEAEIYDALLRKRQLSVTYLNRNAKSAKRRIVNPLGLVLRGSIHYLICTMDEDVKNPRFLPLHRFKSAEWSGEDAYEPMGFSIDKYLEENNLGYLYSSKAIKLDVVFYGSAGFHLSETPLSKDQKIFEDKKRGGMRVKATLEDTAQLRWWLLGFSDQVEVLGPKALRDEFIEVTKKMVSIYK